MKRLAPLPTLITIALSACGPVASSRPPAEVAPRVAPSATPTAGSAVLDDLLRADLTADSAFPWSAARRLRWSDFRGQPPGRGEEGAKTAYALYYAWKCRGAAFDFRVIAAFRPRQSWVKAVIVNDSAQRRSALGHEQTHFDLAEIHAQKMRQYFNELPEPCRKTEPELTALARGLLQEEKAEQRRYDAETEHGLRSAPQATWSQDVARRLRGGEPIRLNDAVEPQAVLRAMTAVADWQLANPSAYKAYEWQGAPFWAGLYELAVRSSSRQTYLDAIRRNGESAQWQPGPQPFLADDHAVTQSYFLLYRLAAERSMIEPALARFDQMLRAPFAESLEWSEAKTLREWVWCDALFMSPPALALAASATGDRRYVALMDRLWWKTTDYLYDKRERLFYRDSRFFEQRERNGQKVFWSRGNGWVLAGLARVLQYLPKDYAGRKRYVALFQDMAARIARLQGPDGYWRASLLDPASRPIPETSGTGFFTYALAWGMNEGLLGREYEPTIRRGWSALVRAVHPTGKLGYVQRVGDQPGDTGPEQTEIYGTGAFLLAGSEVFRLARHD